MLDFFTWMFNHIRNPTFLLGLGQCPTWTWPSALGSEGVEEKISSNMLIVEPRAPGWRSANSPSLRSCLKPTGVSHCWHCGTKRAWLVSELPSLPAVSLRWIVSIAEIYQKEIWSTYEVYEVYVWCVFPLNNVIKSCQVCLWDSDQRREQPRTPPESHIAVGKNRPFKWHVRHVPTAAQLWRNHFRNLEKKPFAKLWRNL